MTYENYTELLKNELVCALGCTEPIAVALAAAKAKKYLGSEPVSAVVLCSGNIIKNVKGVTVPNSGGMKGIDAAAALGIRGGREELDLEVLSEVTEEDIEKAKKFIEEGRMEVKLKEGVENLDIEIILKGSDGNEVTVEIKNRHNNVVKIIKNGEVIKEEVQGGDSLSLPQDMSVASIYDYACNTDLSEVRDLLKMQIDLNTAISKEGLSGRWGSSIGSILLMDSTNLRDRARAKAAAGSDARMSGCSLPVVINAGSGNQGITCCMPVIEYAEEHGSDEETLMRALLISNLCALHIKSHIGRLSAFCGVTSAGAAAGAGIAYLETQDLKVIEDTISNALMIASGMVCDGAKPSCAAKIATAVDAGITGYNIARQGKNFSPGEGLMKDGLEETIDSIGRMAKEGMKDTDIEVLNIMLDR